MGIDQPGARNTQRRPHSPLCGLSSRFGQASMGSPRIEVLFAVSQVTSPLT